MPRPPVETLWCSNPRAVHGHGWTFPPAVDKLLRRELDGQKVVHLFGGQAKWGVRLDIDRLTRPHVIGDAWLPPFARDSFDTAILDPPYIRLNSQEKNALFRAAAWVARERLVLFHTLWVDDAPGCRVEKAWLVRVGSLCVVRALIFFRVSPDKPPPVKHFTRGPAMKYNRWLAGQDRLPL